MKYTSKLMIMAFCAISVLSCVKEQPVEEPFIDNRDPDQENVITSNPDWEWVDKFPGMLPNGIERVFDVEVTVKGGYAPLAFAPDTSVLQSTSLYAPSSEDITIVVPEGVSGLQYQIGIGHELLPGQLRKRHHNVVKRGNLSPGENVVKSNFGGYLYFCYPPDKVPSGDITVTVSGAVESYDYIQGMTDPNEYLNTMLARAALLSAPTESEEEMAFLRWTELISDKVILTAGVSEMSALTNPNVILDYYGKIVDAYYWFVGLDPTDQPPMRIYSDIQLPDAGQTPMFSAANVERYGRYPIGYLRGDTDAKFIDEKKLLNTYYLMAQTDARDNSNWLKFLLAFGDAVATEWQKDEKFNWALLKTTQYLYAATIGLTPGLYINFIDNVTKINTDWPRTDNNFDKGLMWGHIGADAQTTLFMQLVNEYGWGILPYISERCRELGFVYEEEPMLAGQAARDFFAMCASEYADRNLLPFFRIWHFPVSTIAMDYMKNFDDFEEGEEFWKTFDGSVTPSFEKRDGNRQFRQPSSKLTFSMADTDLQASWYLEGRLLEYNSYNDPDNPRDSVIRSNNSINNTNWPKAFDGDITKGVQIMGHCQPSTGSAWAHIPSCTLSFTGPDPVEEEPGEGTDDGTGEEGDETPEEDGMVYNQDPLTFNTFVFCNSNVYYMTSYIYDIEWWDEDAQEWKPTVPNEFKLLYTHEYEFYYFEETYTTKKVQFKLQPITPGTSGYSICEMNEINFGLVEEVSLP